MRNFLICLLSIVMMGIINYAMANDYDDVQSHVKSIGANSNLQHNVNLFEKISMRDL